MQPIKISKMGKNIQDNNYLDNIAKVFNNISLGYFDADGNALPDNIKGTFEQGTSPGSANTQFTVYHGLGYIPLGFLVLNKNKAAEFYTISPADITNLYLACNVASTNYLIMVLG